MTFNADMLTDIWQDRNKALLDYETLIGKKKIFCVWKDSKTKSLNLMRIRTWPQKIDTGVCKDSVDSFQNKSKLLLYVL